MTSRTALSIETIDLQGPPSFVRVAQNLQQLAEVTTYTNPAVSTWLYRPDWGDLETIFDRKTTLPAPFGEHCDLATSAGQEKALKSLNSEKADAFLDRCASLADAFLANLDGMQGLTATMRFNSAVHRNTGIHIDPMQLRVTMATEVGNTIIADDAAGMLVRGKKWVMPEQAQERGHRLYAAPLGCFTFMRGSHLASTLQRDLGRGTAHAVYPNPPDMDYSRPFMTLDYKAA